MPHNVMPDHRVSRRRLIHASAAATVSILFAALARYASASKSNIQLPKMVAGVRLPDTALALEAVRLSQAASPPFLFNHCMRTFVFGAMAARRNKIAFDEELIFVAAALHDLGLTPGYTSKDQPFEMDSADAAKVLLARRGVPDSKAELVWNAIAMHTSPLVAHQAPQVGLVGTGAGTDVFGSGLKNLAESDVNAVLAAFPRLGFKAGFESLLEGYCQRKPIAQVGTWTDAFCRSHAPDAHFPDLARRLADSPFAE